MKNIMSKPDKIIDRVLYGVDVVIFNPKDEILMLSRNVKSENFETGWEFVKGGLKFDEDFQQAAMREIAEEVGNITIKYIGELPYYFEVDARYRNKPHYDFVHKKALVYYYQDGVVIIDSGEHDNFKWMPYSEAYELIWVENGKEILEEAKKIFDEWGKNHILRSNNNLP